MPRTKTTDSPDAIAVKRPRRRRRRSRSVSFHTEIRQSARQIYQSGMVEAMKAAALVIVARKLDEIKSLVAASGLSGAGISQEIATLAGVSAPQHPAQPSPPPVKNPCVHCGRAGFYRSKPSQFNKTGSWFCKTHLVLARQVEAEDRFDRTIQPSPQAEPPSPGLVEQIPAPAPGASSLAEAMGMAEISNEQT